MAHATITDIRKIRDGNRRSFEKLALPIREDLLRAATKLTRNPSDAEDLVQEAYLRAFRFYHKFEEGTNFEAWIFTILRNCFISSFRRKQNRPVHVQGETLDLMTQERNPEEIYDIGEAVHKALDRLPDDVRQAVILSDFEGLKYREIAEVLGWPIGTVMSRMFRARKQLQEELKNVA